ncbi:MAG: hypothetical protein GY880_00310 [Planctomycetaceae bacterium]|nr:hypothetical protein [Planctomycetaceae bacterium]
MNSECGFSKNWIVKILVLPALFLNQDLIDDARVVNCEVLAYGIDERRPCKVTAMGGDGLIIDVPLRAKSKC